LHVINQHSAWAQPALSNGAPIPRAPVRVQHPYKLLLCCRLRLSRTARVPRQAHGGGTIRLSNPANCPGSDLKRRLTARGQRFLLAFFPAYWGCDLLLAVPWRAESVFTSALTFAITPTLSGIIPTVSSLARVP
jgi:hypothetical protein